MEPTILDWVTGVGQIVAVSVASVAAFQATRSARAAERAVDAQTWPLLLQVPARMTQEAEEEARIPGGGTHGAYLKGGIFTGDESSASGPYLSFPVRNAGRGLARINTAVLRAESPDSLPMTFSGFEAADHENVPPGEETRMLLAPSDTHEDGVEITAFTEAVMGDSCEVRVLYSDLTESSKWTLVLRLQRVPYLSVRRGWNLAGWDV